jgi:hypothetical protein
MSDFRFKEPDCGDLDEAWADLVEEMRAERLEVKADVVDEDMGLCFDFVE